MTEPTRYVETYCYLQLEPVWAPNWQGDKVRGVKVAKMTQSRPSTPPGAPIIKVCVKVPAAALEPYVTHLESDDLGEVPKPIVEVEQE